MWGLALVGLALALAGCRARRGDDPEPPRNRFVWGRTPAAGATATCPDDAVDLTGDPHHPTTDDVRCSYADAAHGQARIEGKVLREVPGALGRALEGVEVVLVRLGDDGSAKAVARTKTDAQGGFSLGARVTAGSYAVRSAGGSSAPWTWDGKGPWNRSDLVVFVP